ncbi:P-loop containing nucleoside triphosphate hydrolase protein [Nemania sp. FL0916]|nr:P-loop containing nucleoside triphosphate hydrolase protein [Nemania sp. FL0916]
MSDQEVCLAVFGKTGAGKTSFIKCATGADLEIGHCPDSTTKKIQRVTIPPEKLGGRKVTLIDTPGFSDTDLQDGELFLNIVDWLVGSHRNDEPLNGAIFLQGINEVRVLQAEKDGAELFEKIIGTTAFEQVIILTTMWDQVEEDFGSRNERNRKANWANMTNKGAKLYRFLNTEDSALEIIDACLGFPRIKFQLQEELIRHGGKVRETSAAKFLQESLGVKIDDIRQQMKIAGSSDRLRRAVHKMKGWLKILKGAVIRISYSAWKPVAAIAGAWFWDIQTN